MRRHGLTGNGKEKAKAFSKLKRKPIDPDALIMAEYTKESNALRLLDGVWGRQQSVKTAMNQARWKRELLSNRARSARAARNRYSRLKFDPCFKVKHMLRNCVARVARVYKSPKSRRTIEYLGCTVQEARQVIEKKFRDGMTWANHGQLWELDHIRPLCSFDFTDDRDVLAANHISNLQPLLKEENRVKAGAYPSPG